MKKPLGSLPFFYMSGVPPATPPPVVGTGTSQAVPHLSTNPALRRLTSEFEWDPVFSTQYGRQQYQQQIITINISLFIFQMKLFIKINRFFLNLNFKVDLISYIKKFINTKTSQAVPHLSTNPALRRLTSELEWDLVFSKTLV
ncbi:hypothetical protein TTHERM_000200570 (macronuclear) [Tetrahymena thermophila SB210]|uniref:Uncharacterized protein n=1 Tax=Tetrahymena thermophila (strain SB210) TaxID=312017 RepID=W7XFL0_TETTS|nr:hypothetical protein TTHERM_000200570 [Tetrahymena thermophila SB210]EWS76642.1 hypothetical protein TTHERM_000200570 [Tetrahymena thermophila SB210]|eukprot:XP_012650810.1 hypothetical protein TTHERM_000200570 [Tetrahymena thermophila SB210]